MDECIEWSKSRTRQGYGNQWDPVRKVMRHAHTLAWEVVHGPIPRGKVVRHRCDNPPCTNIEHLVMGTQADNVADMVARGRQSRQTGRSGAANPMAKLTDEDVVDIRRRLPTTTQRALATEYGVSSSTIGLIGLRRIWAHV